MFEYVSAEDLSMQWSGRIEYLVLTAQKEKRPLSEAEAKELIEHLKSLCQLTTDL